MTRRLFFLTILMLLLTLGCANTMCDAMATPWLGKPVTWDRHSLMIDGRRVCPVMGEVHYSRIPADEWAEEVRKMKAGGVTIVATYVFWNHIEEEQGIFRWDGQRDLRRFLEECKKQQMPVVLRIGPFCHGEVRNGGMPDWLWNLAPTPSQKEDGSKKTIRLRSTDPTFLHYVERLYRQIFTQVEGLQWKDGGPVIAAQFDNEYRGSGDYLMALKQLATSIGFDLPFYTRTGWPELSKPVPFGEMLPLYGDYADGFWDKSTDEATGNYYKAFNFKAYRSSTAIATDQFTYTDNAGQQHANRPSQTYPYFTCELGGGMATAYHRRPYIYADDCYSLAVVKMGSGSNLLGYYMYHGGTNPKGKLNTLNEVQTSPGTANNDLPVCTYDFQAPLGEFGQTALSYYRLRPLHLFLQDYGEQLAPMEAHFPAPQDLKQGEDTSLRWAVRSLDDSTATKKGTNRPAFIFVNNYERLQTLTAKTGVTLEACGVTLPPLTIPSGTMAIFPVNIDGIRYATAQVVASRNGRIYLMQVPGIPVTIALQNGHTLKDIRPQGIDKPVYKNMFLLTQQDAERLFLETPERLFSDKATSAVPQAVAYHKTKAAGALRTIVKGRAKVAEAPSEADWQQAAVYRIERPAGETTSSDNAQPDGANLLKIHYRGDCARLYALTEEDLREGRDGTLIADNFYHGRPFLFGLWRLPEGCTALDLRILPLQPTAPIYLPREADKTAGEEVKAITL